MRKEQDEGKEGRTEMNQSMEAMENFKDVQKAHRSAGAKRATKTSVLSARTWGTRAVAVVASERFQG